MELAQYAFTKRIIIEGMSYPVAFTFRMLTGAYETEYNIRSSNPLSDFNMHNNGIPGNTTFWFKDENEIPAWLKKDKSAQLKLSHAILSTR